MNYLQKFTLSQLVDMLADQHSVNSSNYLSRNLLVARDVNPNVFASHFLNQTIVLTEMRVLVITEGWAEPIVNLVPKHIGAGDLIHLSANSIVQFTNFSTDVKGFGVSMSDELFALAVGDNVPKTFDGHLRDFIIHLEVDELMLLDNIHYLLYKYISQGNSNFHVVLHLLGALIHQFSHLRKAHETMEHNPQSREQRLFVDFMQLLAQFAAQEHNIIFYASQLCISPRYMSSIIKNVSGKAAKQWIDDAIVTRAKVALRHSNKQVAEIADELCFSNVSFFCKFFKRLVGVTPLQFRLQK